MRKRKRVELEPYEEGTRVYGVVEKPARRHRLAYVAIPVGVALAVVLFAVLPPVAAPPPRAAAGTQAETEASPSSTQSVPATVSYVGTPSPATQTATAPPLTEAHTTAVHTTAQIATTTPSTAPLSEIPIASCMNITKPGYYYLAKDIVGAQPGKDYCILIDSDNVTIDGRGHVVVPSRGKSAVKIGGLRAGIVIRNVIVENADDGINGRLENCVIEGSRFTTFRHGVSIGARNCVIRNNEFVRTGLWLWLWYSWNNTVVNNVVNGKPLFYIEGRRGVVVENVDVGQVIVVGSEDVVLRGLRISNTSIAVVLYNVTNATIENGSLFYNGIGVLVVASKNVVILNSTVKENAGGIGVLNSSTVILSGNKILENEDAVLLIANFSKITQNIVAANRRGIYLERATYNTISDNRIINNTEYGIYLYLSANNKIYNNLFFNYINAVVQESGYNSWNTEPQKGRNILGGLWVGGNAWLSPDGRGCSQICRDRDGDGICEDSCKIDEQNVDYFPLKHST